MEPQPNNPPADLPTLPRSVEAAIVGGLGLFVYYGPPVVNSIWHKISEMRPRVAKIYVLTKSKIARRLEPLQRRRRNGSMIRVVASLLPDWLFEPTCRIYFVPNANNLVNGRLRSEDMYGDENTVLTMLMKQDATYLTADEDDDLIVAFELDTESNDGEIEDNASNSAYAWDHRDYLEPAEFTIPDFINGEKSCIVSCSTPTPLPSVLPTNQYLNESISTQGDDFNVHQNKKEIDELKDMIQMLMNRATVQDQTIATLQMTVVENQNNTSLAVPVLRTTPILATPNVVTAGPPPPPPPPPPMPQMALLGSQPLIKLKKSQQRDNLPGEKSAPSMSEVLKDLPNAKKKLKQTLRSPGGTPMKIPRQSAGRTNDLQYALRKRFAAMHSDDSDGEGGVQDKENKENSGFDDSFETSTTSKRNFKNSPSSLSAKKLTDHGNRDRRSVGRNGIALFGQHLLKKSNQNQTMTVTSQEPTDVQVLRDRNH